MLNWKAGAIACLCAGAVVPVAPAGESGIAAIVGGQKITTAELDATLLTTNMKLAQSLYDARKKALDQMILDKLLEPEAKAGGISVDELRRKRVAEKATPVTDADVQAYYDKNQARLRGRTLEQIGGQIRTMLLRQSESAALDALLAELKAKSNVKIMLDVPRARVNIAANDPVKGPKDAKVTIVEFSDFQ